MEDMGMSMEGMVMGDMTHSQGSTTMPGMEPSVGKSNGKEDHANHNSQHMEHMEHREQGTPSMQGTQEMPSLKAIDSRRSKIPGVEPVKHGPDDHGPGNQMVAEYSQNRLGEPGRGLEDSERRVLLY